MDLGWPEVLLILAIVLIVFGVGKLPEVASQMGKGIREFRKAQRGDDDDGKQPDGLADNKSKLVTHGSHESAPDPGEQTVKDELKATKARLEAAEARVKELQESANKAQGTPQA